MAHSVAEAHARTKNGVRDCTCRRTCILCLQPIQCGGSVLKYVIGMSPPGLLCSLCCSQTTQFCSCRQDCYHEHQWLSVNAVDCYSHGRCCFQAMVLVTGQISNLSDPVLNADPLFGVTGMPFSCLNSTAVPLLKCSRTNALFDIIV